jgi:hypothetical protein
MGEAIGLAITVLGLYLTNSFRRQQRVKIAEQRVKSYSALWEITDDARPSDSTRRRTSDR